MPSPPQASLSFVSAIKGLTIVQNVGILSRFRRHAMTTADLIRSILPDEKAIAAATESSRQIAAFVSTQLDTQHIELIDEAQ